MIQTVETIQLVDINSLTPYANNPRTHSPAQVDMLVNSLKEFGFVNPILTGDDGQIVAGHGRLMAALALDMKTVPVVRLSHLTAEQKRAFVIADNQLALNSGWDDALLQQELAALGDVGFDLTVLGWGDDLPTFEDDVDLSALDDLDDPTGDLMDGVMKAIQIEFRPEDYEEGKARVEQARKAGIYIGDVLIQALAAHGAL